MLNQVGISFPSDILKVIEQAFIQQEDIKQDLEGILSGEKVGFQNILKLWMSCPLAMRLPELGTSHC